MIPSRVFLQALQYLLAGRADWLRRKATGRRRNDPGRAPGRSALAEKTARQAAEVAALLHHGTANVPVDAALVAQALAYATGHLGGLPELRRRWVAAAPEVIVLLERLHLLGVLPGHREGGAP